jgi:MATE family multidrug resistance protein
MENSYLQEFKLSLKLALPMMAAYLAEIGIQLTNSVMMGYLGPDALAAGALAVSTNILIFITLLGITNSSGIFIANAYGAKDIPTSIRYWQHGVYLCALISLPIMCLLAHMNTIFTLFHQNLIVITLAQDYLRGEMWGIFPGLAFWLFKDVSATVEKTSIIMMTSIIVLPINALLNYAVIFGKFSLPKLGMYGIGLTCSFVYWIMFLIPLIYGYCHPLFKTIIRAPLQKLQLKYLREIFLLGWPLCCVYFFEAGLFSASAIMMGWVSIAAQAAHQIVIQAVDTAFVLSLGIAQVAGLRVSKYLGAKDLEGLKRSVNVNITLAIFVSLSCTVLFIIYPDALIKIFVKSQMANEAIVVQYARHFFVIAACFVCFDSLKLLANNLLRGLQDTFIPMLLGLSSYWIIGILCGYLLAFKLHWYGIGIWCGLALGISVSAFLLWGRWILKLRLTQNANKVIK